MSENSRRTSGLAKVIQLPQSNPAERPARELEQLVARVGSTLVGLVDEANAAALEVPDALRYAAELLKDPSAKVLLVPEAVAQLASGESNEDMNRREFIRLFGEAAAVASAGVFTPEILDLRKSLEFSSVGNRTLGYLEATAIRFEEDYARVGASEVKGPILTLLNSVNSNLREPQGVQQRRRLSGVAAQLSSLMRYVSWDLHERDAAADWCEVTMQAALEAGDDARCAYALGSRSLISIYLDRPEEALRFISGAQRFVARTNDLPMAAWLNSLEAHAQAKMGQLAACRSALGQAEGALDRAQSRRAGIDFFDYPRLISTKGTCYMLLQQPKDAQPALLEALTLHPVTHEKYRSLVQLELARTYLQERDIEAAYETGVRAIAIPADKRVGPLVQREAELRAAFAPWDSRPAVKDLRAQLLSVGSG